MTPLTTPAFAGQSPGALVIRRGRLIQGYTKNYDFSRGGVNNSKI